MSSAGEGQVEGGKSGGGLHLRRRHLVDISALTAIASLVVALVFNGLAVRDSANQEKETRLATQLQLLTQLDGLVAQTQATVAPRDAEFLTAEARSGTLSAHTNSDFAVALKDMDYLAWLLNNRYVAISGARQLWSRRMVCLYVTAVLVYGAPAAERLENLARFVDLRPGESLTHLRSTTC